MISDPAGIAAKFDAVTTQCVPVSQTFYRWNGFFVPAEAYGFSPSRNLALAALMGLCYTVSALNSGRLARGSAPRAVLFAAFGIWTAAALAPLLLPGRELVVWVVAPLGSAASATAFPIVESYLVAGRHGAAMRSAIGW